MSLHLLTGSTGTGKTYHLYKSIIDSAIQHPGKRHVVLVPEQFTMQTQRALVEMHPGHAILNIEVMSFDWLAHQILKDLSKPGVHILDDSGISMLLRKSAGEKKKELAFFRRNLTKAGFISRMKSMLAELLQYGITEEDLARLKNEVQDHPILAAKLADLQIFYHAFQENRDPDVIAAEELAPILLRELPHSDSRLEPPAKPKAFSACFKDTLVSSPLPFQPDTYGTKSMCRWGVASSMWRKAPNTRSVGFRSWKPCIYSSSSSFASAPFSVKTPISSLLPIWTINSWKSFSCLPVRRCS